MLSAQSGAGQTAIGEILTSKNYKHIKKYETEILKLKEQGITQRKIGEKLGFCINQVKNFFTDTTEPTLYGMNSLSVSIEHNFTLSSCHHSFFGPSSLVR